MPQTLTGLIELITQIALSTIPILVSLALLFFLWGLALFILDADNDKGRKAGREKMVWGLVALFVILSIGGLVAIIERTFIAPSGSGYGGSLYGGGTPRTGGGTPPLEGTLDGGGTGGTGYFNWCVGRGWLNVGSGCN